MLQRLLRSAFSLVSGYGLGDDHKCRQRWLRKLRRLRHELLAGAEGNAFGGGEVFGVVVQHYTPGGSSASRSDAGYPADPKSHL